MSSRTPNRLKAVAIAVLGFAGSAAVLASSHREAPAITKTPKLDATDFYCMARNVAMADMVGSYPGGPSPRAV